MDISGWRLLLEIFVLWLMSGATIAYAIHLWDHPRGKSDGERRLSETQNEEV